MKKGKAGIGIAIAAVILAVMIAVGAVVKNY